MTNNKSYAPTVTVEMLKSIFYFHPALVITEVLNSFSPFLPTYNLLAHPCNDAPHDDIQAEIRMQASKTIVWGQSETLKTR